MKRLGCALLVAIGWCDMGVAMESKSTPLGSEARKILGTIRQRVVEDSLTANARKWWRNKPDAVRNLITRASDNYSEDLDDLVGALNVSSSAQARDAVYLFSYLLHEQYQRSDALDAVSTNRKMIDVLTRSLAQRLGVGSEPDDSAVASIGPVVHEACEQSSDEDGGLCGVCSAPICCHSSGLAVGLSDDALCYLTSRRDSDAVPIPCRDRATQTLLY